MELIEIEIVSLIISIIAIIISIIDVTLNLIRYRKNIELSIKTYRISNLKGAYFYICYIQIVNNSKIPIAIKGISCNGCNVPSKPYLVAEYTKRKGKEIVSYDEVKTIQFPINLDGLQGYSGYIEFKNKEKLDMQKVKFTIYTNRGTINNPKIDYKDIKDDINYSPFN